ncbi:hypothetical protein [Catalinimonas alkaloidigena]|uniref:hypothetical protein n=1 Tax=Catalinimonas alkaloidigena TaxID=1075417 RepID=UPI001C40942C|nr:hypothetical protein [Catalinimonas alkaloidigena]
MFYSHGSGLSIEPVMAIRIKPIEEIHRKISSRNNNIDIIDTKVDVYKLDDNTDGIYRKNSSLSIACNDKNETENAVNLIIYCFENAALEYFDRYSSVSDIDSAINDNPEYKSVLTGSVEPLRYIIGLIVAKLNNNPSLDQLIGSYSQKINAIPFDPVRFKKEFSDLLHVL